MRGFEGSLELRGLHLSKLTCVYHQIIHEYILTSRFHGFAENHLESMLPEVGVLNHAKKLVVKPATTNF